MLIERPDSRSSIFSLDITAHPQLKEKQMFVLLRIYSPTEEPANQFVIQEGNKLLDFHGNEMQLEAKTYSKCYNWSQLYDVDQPINPYDARLEWSDGNTPGGQLRTDYCTLKWGGVREEGDRLVVYRHWEGNRIAEAGIARQHGEELYRADGTQITDDVHTIEIGNWFNQRILRGDLDPADPTMNSMGWKRPTVDAFWEGEAAQPEAQTAQVAIRGQSTAQRAYQTVKLTFYYVPHSSEARFGGDEAVLKENGKLNGTYMDSNGTYWNWQNGSFVEVDHPLTSLQTMPTADYTLAVPPEWRGKYIAIVRNGRLVVSGYGEDSGGRFTAGSSKIDVYAGEGEEAYRHGINNYYGTCRAYMFNSESEMNRFVEGL
ncbi:hypothetical protein DRN67_00345 [Candidatus Micrarchaeota archaeon]|nr:MAG: hypothetical protein DRN67_00345 [Candidatus Micrarchaeota archaeon]